MTTDHLPLMEMLRILRDAGATSTSTLMALTALQESPMCQKELAARLRLTPCGCSGVIDRLEGCGLVVRKKGQNDTRVRVIHLTQLGQAGADRLVAYLPTL